MLPNTNPGAWRTVRPNNAKTPNSAAEKGGQRALQGEGRPYASLKTFPNPESSQRSPFLGKGGRERRGRGCKRLGVRCFVLEGRSWSVTNVFVTKQLVFPVLTRKGQVPRHSCLPLRPSGAGPGCQPVGRPPDPAQCHHCWSRRPRDPAGLAALRPRLPGAGPQTVSRADSCCHGTAEWMRERVSSARVGPGGSAPSGHSLPPPAEGLRALESLIRPLPHSLHARTAAPPPLLNGYTTVAHPQLVLGRGPAQR